jgi:HK97 family phage prohead protease
MRKFKNFKIEKALDASSPYDFTGYASTFGNADRQGEVMSVGCFDNTLANQKIYPMCVNHDINNVIGNITCSVDNHGLLVQGSINKDLPNGQIAYSQIQHGDVTSMSINFIPKDWTPIDPESPYGAWNYKDVELLEISLVTIPCNPQADITDVKNMNFEEKEHNISQDEIEKKVNSAVKSALNIQSKRQKINELLKSI